MRIIYNHLGMYKLRDEPQIGQLIQQAGNKAVGKGEGWRKRAANTVKGRREERQQQNQIKRQINVTNTTTKAVRHSSMRRRWRDGGGGGRVESGQGHWAGSQRSRSRKRRPQNGCLKTQLHNNLFTFFHTPSTLNELAAPARDDGEREKRLQGASGRGWLAGHVARLEMSNAKTMGGESGEWAAVGGEQSWAEGTRNQITSPH